MVCKAFPVKHIIGCLFLLLGLTGQLAFAQPAPVQPVFPGDTWENHPDIEAAGWSTSKLKSLQKYAKAVNSSAYIIIENGYVVDSWGAVGQKEIVQSVRKSLLSGLYGIYVEKGAIKRDATMASLGIDDKEKLTPAEKEATVQHLLQARSGVYHPSAASTPGMIRNLPARGSHAPGTNWYYNNWDFNVLGTIFNQETGEDLYEAFDEHIAKEIWMEDFNASDGHYFKEGMSDHKAYHFFMSARDMARFGWLFAQNGRWEDKQIIPADWVEESTKSYSETNEGGYGYMWWKDIPGVPADLDAYAARGGGGHMILVVPEANLVFVHRVPMRTHDAPGWREVVQMIGKVFDARS